jgi:hypothetical protein
VVFYEMLTGELPLGRFPAPSETTGVDPRLDNVVFRTLEKQRERRYQTAGEMKTQVESLASAPAHTVQPPPMPLQRAERTSRKAIWGFVLTVAGILLMLLSVFGTSVKVRSSSMSRDLAQMRVQEQRSLLLNLAEQARHGVISQEEFDRRLRELSTQSGLNGPLQWFPTYPPRPVPEPAEKFRLRIQKWIEDLNNNPHSIPQLPSPGS